MACTASHTPFRYLLSEASTNRPIPLFLAPALFSSSQRTFSTSRPRRSRVGNAPISVPQEVTLRFFDLPRQKVKTRNPDEPTSAVEVVGPLGQMTLPLPPYLQTQHNAETKKVTVNILDQKDKHQRAMWGGFSRLLFYSSASR